MSDIDRHDDAQFDALLRDLGPSVPQPELDQAARDRLLATLTIDETTNLYRRAGHFPRWVGTMAAAGAGLAAVLGLICVIVFTKLDQTNTQLATARWETQEALVLLMKARQVQSSVSIPNDLSGVHHEDLMLVTFHHDLCPIAEFSTPAFQDLANANRNGKAQFLTLDVTGENRDEADLVINQRDIGYALRAPLGAETGVVTVIDTRTRQILSSAPGDQGLRQAAQVLAAVP